MTYGTRASLSTSALRIAQARSLSFFPAKSQARSNWRTLLTVQPRASAASGTDKNSLRAIVDIP